MEAVVAALKRAIGLLRALGGLGHRAGIRTGRSFENKKGGEEQMTAEEPAEVAAEQTAEAPAAEQTAEAPAAEETAATPAAEETAEAPVAEETAEAPAAVETAEAPAAEAPATTG
jgi:hypothetical protein